MRIQELHIEAVKRIKVVDITCDANEDIITIGGNNAQGKTSVLDSIMYALAGGKTIPDKPVRDGEESAKIVLDIGDFIITRTMRGSKSSVKVETKDGMSPKQPQATLTKLCGPIAFDPLEFARMKPKEQLSTLRTLLGVDTSELDAEIQSTFNKRAEVNKEGVRLKGEFESIVFEPDLEHVDVKALTVEIEKASTHNLLKGQAGVTLSGIQKGLRDLEESDELSNGRIEKLKTEIADMESHIEKNAVLRSGLLNDKLEVEKFIEEFKEVDVEVLREKVAKAEEVNDNVRKQKESEIAAAKLESQRGTSKVLGDKLEVLRAKKDHALSSIEYPIDGLTMGDDGLLWNGQPFEQASSAESTQVSVALGMANNPKLRVMLIRDGSLLDGSTMESIREMAKGKDYQIWIERVGTSDDNSIIIEDGEVLEKEVV